MQDRSFTDLANDPSVISMDVCAALKTYVEMGRDVDAQKVIELVKRTKPNRPEQTALLDLARRGFQWKRGKRQKMAAAEYNRVVVFLLQFVNEPVQRKNPYESTRVPVRIA